MKFINKLCLLFLFIAQTVNASECETNTVARKLGFDKAEIKFEILDKKTGKYLATLQNGDLLMAAFLQCGLGMQAHLYARNIISSEQRANILRSFLAAVLPDKSTYPIFVKQIDSSKKYVNNEMYTLSDDYEGHTFEFKTSESPLFKTAVHYRWQPPQR